MEQTVHTDTMVKSFKQSPKTQSNEGSFEFSFGSDEPPPPSPPPKVNRKGGPGAPTSSTPFKPSIKIRRDLKDEYKKIKNRDLDMFRLHYAINQALYHTDFTPYLNNFRNYN